MRQVPPSPALRLLHALAAIAALSAIAFYTARSLGTHLWMDELLTLHLAAADSLPKLWTGVAIGIDGNPPLYMTLAWLAVHAAPAGIPDVAAVRAINVIIVLVGVLALARISLRLVAPLAAWTGGFLFVMLNSNLDVLAFDLRTYGIYFALAAVAALLQIRLVADGRRSDALWLALCCCALVLSHSFGIVYVLCIALSGLLCQSTHLRRQHLRTMLIAVIPALITFCAWLPFFLQQSAIGKPYLWMETPDVRQLLMLLFPSPAAVAIGAVEAGCLVVAAVAALRQHGRAGCRALAVDPALRFARYVLLLAVSMTGFMVAVWLVSRLLFPIFVPRYFAPQLMVGFALHVAFCALVISTLSQRLRFDTSRAADVAAVVLPLLFALTLLREPAKGHEPCTVRDQVYFETAFIDGKLPVISDSPHVYMPRLRHAAHPEAYRFALDWDVVLNYPRRSTGNAVEYHVMNRLRAWEPLASVMTTDEILKAYPSFLVIEFSRQAWFENLRRTRDVAAEKLAETTSPGGDTCTLWRVDSVTPKP